MNKIYTPQGLLHKESLPYIQGSIPAYTEYIYDDYNRLETIISPDGTTTTTTYGANQTSVTTTNEGISRTTTKKYNAAGWLIESTDNKGNVVKNEYYCNGNLSKTYIVGQPATTVTLEYDDKGNRTLLDDPNYGQMTSIYNAFGELEKQTNPRGEITTYSYNKLGQTITETSIEGTTTWLYSTTPRRIGTLESITNNNHLTNYIYDDYLRPKSVTETIAGEPYTTQFTYDELGRPETTTHPTGITVSEGYNEWGFHTSVKMDKNGQRLWKTEEVNPLGMITQFKTGNGLVTDQTFHPLNMRLQTMKTLKQGNAPIQNYEYSWFGLGNLRHRKKGPLTESFTYDNLDRLEKIILNGMTRGNHVYDADDLGNIIDKQSDSQAIFNDAIYGGSNGSITYGPHALSSVATSNPVLTGPEQVITYNGYDKVDAITEGIYSLHIQYGHHKQRISQQYTNGANSVNKVWAGACEFITKNGQLYKHTYISGPMGVFAIHIIKPNGTEEINYIHKDHLGSWNTITDEDGNLLQELSFDACIVKLVFCECSETKSIVEPISAEERGREGNRRNPATWRAFTGTPPAPLFDRGFTGHEHLYAFNLINMNGRVYDPIAGRMLSPDNFMQAPGYSQSLNSYSYCWNNPLKYTDPTGYELGVENRNNWFWWEYRGGSNSTNGIGPGSNNHWSDSHRDKDGDYMLMNSTAYNNKRGSGAWQSAYANNLIQRNSIFSATGQNAVDFLTAFNSNSQDDLALYFYDNIFSKTVAVLGTENQNPFLSGNDANGYKSLFGYGVYSGDAGAAGQGGEKSEPWLTVNFNRGIPQIETNFTDKDWGAITPGPFIVYPKGGSKDKYYNTQEPGHVIQLLILGPVAYYGLVAIPSLITSTTPYHSDMPWEKSANQLWYWLTGENDPRNPLYFGPNKK